MKLECVDLILLSWHIPYCRHAHLFCFFSYQVVAEAVDMVELSVSEAESPTDSEPLTEIVLHGK